MPTSPRITPFVLTAILAITPSIAFSQTSEADASKSESAKVSKAIEAINADIVAARKATAEKRYADAEALMLKATDEKPNLLIPRLELGLAQIGLKKYAEAEVNFQKVLGIDPASVKLAHSQEFYRPDTPQATYISRNTVGGKVLSEQSRTPEIKGVAYSSLGEIYIHNKRFADAKIAFDTAVQANPSQAPLYLRNETVFFFQAGDADGQLEAAEKAIVVDPTRAMLYFFKAQALVSKATVDTSTGKMVLPAGCGEAYQKYLQMEPTGPYSADSRSVLIAAGIAPAGKPGKS